MRRFVSLETYRESVYLKCKVVSKQVCIKDRDERNVILPLICSKIIRQSLFELKHFKLAF